MKWLLAFIAAALSSAASAQSQVVGRVLLAAGDAFAVRNGQQVRLEYNSPVEFKDLLRTGAASSLQVRFVDESLLSLREGTEFQIEEYRFAAQQDVMSERAFFRLVKGGFRAVTGLIGRTQNANYRVQTQTATIGIRGTDYAVRMCAGDCGANVKDGLYGSVLGLSSGTNQVTVQNEATPQPVTFGINQHFHVAAPNAPPQQLLQPPTFVAVKPQGKAAATQQGGQGSGGEEASAASGVSAESRPQSVVDASATITPVTSTTPYTVTNTTAVSSSLVGDVGLLGCGGDMNNPGCGGALGFFQDVTFGTEGGVPIITGFSNFIDDVGGTVQTTISATKGSLPAVNTGCVNAAGCGGSSDSSFNAWWGRWQDGTIVDNGVVEPFNSTTGNGQGLHYLLVTGLTPFDVITSKTGVATFHSNLGTLPTNNLGQVGSITSGGGTLSMNVNFGANPSGTMQPFSILIGSQSFSFTSLPMAIGSDLGGKIAQIEYVNHTTGLSGVCSGATCAGLTFLDIHGAFAGQLARHMGLVFEIKNNNIGTGMVRLFFCQSGAC